MLRGNVVERHGGDVHTLLLSINGLGCVVDARLHYSFLLVRYAGAAAYSVDIHAVRLFPADIYSIALQACFVNNLHIRFS